jgi:hypothetical protein
MAEIAMLGVVKRFGEARHKIEQAADPIQAVPLAKIRYGLTMRDSFIIFYA